MLTLWDLIAPKRKRKRAAEAGGTPAPLGVAIPEEGGAPAGRAKRRAAQAAARSRPSMQDRYDGMTREMLAQYGVRVRRWRTSMTGCAWEVYYHDGRVTRLIEAPRPKGPMSAAVFLHEIGHHAIGFNRYKPRCLEEHYAWDFALREMEKRGLNVTAGVLRRRDESLQYAIGKARRRGLKVVPAELAEWDRPLRRRKSVEV